MSDELGTVESGIPAQRGAGRLSESLIRLAIGFLVVVLATGIGYIFAADLISPDAPRSTVERATLLYDEAVLAYPESPQPHADYARALTAAGQYSQAREILDRAVVTMPGEPILLVELARTLHAQGDEGVAGVLEDAYTLISSIRDAYVEDLSSRGIEPDTLPEQDALVAATLLEADIARDADDHESAIEAYTRALKEDPTMADVLTLRGQAYLEVGDTEAARADFDAALLYVPEFAPALTGLATIEGDDS